jgi:hypothetical protein
VYKYKIVTPYGTFERKSKKLYSHLVVFHGNITLSQTAPNVYEPSKTPEQIHTMAEYCGRYDLAVKTSERFKNKNGYVGTVEIFEIEGRE